MQQKPVCTRLKLKVQNRQTLPLQQILKLSSSVKNSHKSFFCGGGGFGNLTLIEPKVYSSLHHCSALVMFSFNI